MPTFSRALQLAFSRGAVASVSRRLARGRTVEEAAAAAGSTFGLRTQEDLFQLGEFGVRGRTAAERLAALGPEDSPFSIGAPVVPDETGTLFEGGRWRYEVEIPFRFGDEGEDQFRRLIVHSPGALSAAELQTIAESQFEAFQGRSPGFVGDDGPIFDLQFGEINIIDVERSF